MNPRFLVICTTCMILCCGASLKHNQTEMESIEHSNQQLQNYNDGGRENTTMNVGYDSRLNRQIYNAKRSFKENYKMKNDFNLNLNQSKYNFSSDFGDLRNVNISDKGMFEQNSTFKIFNETLDDRLEWRDREDAFVITSPEQYPYSVLIVMMAKGAVKGICTGSLLTDQWVLTASHCLAGASTVRVYAGGNSYDELKSKDMPATSQLRDGVRLITHPLYGGGDSDVGLVKVDRRFNMTRYVATVRLATDPWSTRYHTYTTCFLTGFGIVQIDQKNIDDSHRKTNQLEVKSPCLCSFRLKMLFGSKTASRYICTKPKKDYGVCPGDSGGGLVCDGLLRGVTMQLIKLSDTDLCDLGLFSPIKCGGPTTLSVFEDICPYLHWINRHVKLFNDSSVISKKCKLVSKSCHSCGSSFLLLFFSLIFSINILIL